jgi:hypothetical protein
MHSNGFEFGIAARILAEDHPTIQIQRTAPKLWSGLEVELNQLNEIYSIIDLINNFWCR